MKAEIIWGTLMAVEDDKLTIFTTTSTPEGETLELPSRGFTINEEWINTWLGVHVQFKIIDGVVTDVSS